MASRDLTKLIQPFQDSINLLVKRAKEQGLPILVTETTRTLAEQKENVRKGFSKTLNSKHLIGEAVDIAFQVDGKLSYDAKLYERLYSIAKDIPFVIWPFKDLGWNWDKPHWQYDKTKKPATIPPMSQVEELKAQVRALNTEIGRVTQERDKTRQALDVSQKKEKENYVAWQLALDSRQPWAIKWLKDKLGL